MNIDWNEYVGKKFNRLTVLRIAGINKYNRVIYECQCDCGRKKHAEASKVKNGALKSCGCLQSEVVGKNFEIHGLTNTRLFRIWQSMKARCYDPNHSRYYAYGARGITVCEEWLHDFQAFYDWAIANGYADNLSIDRKDVNGNYEPSNCKWSTDIEQANNTTRNRYVTYRGVTMTAAEWARHFGFNYKYFHEKLKDCNWSIADLLEIPYFKEKVKCS